ncbi:hypothetical protein PRNP1_012614 [Phytophthora ramorum]
MQLMRQPSICLLISLASFSISRSGFLWVVRQSIGCIYSHFATLIHATFPQQTSAHLRKRPFRERRGFNRTTRRLRHESMRPRVCAGDASPRDERRHRGVSRLHLELYQINSAPGTLQTAS